MNTIRMNSIRKTLSTIFLCGASLSPMLAGALLSAPLLSNLAHAAAPKQAAQAPGYYRIPLGAVEVTALSDGTVTIPVDQLLTGTTPAHVDQVLAAHRLAPQVETSINAFLVNTGAHLVLIDAGAGASFGAHAGGRLLDSIRAAGYRPEDIDTVLLTHIHGDHSNGLTVAGKALFPNADVFVEQRDAGLWLDEGKRASVAKEHGHVFDEAHAAFAHRRFGTHPGPHYVRGERGRADAALRGRPGAREGRAVRRAAGDDQLRRRSGCRAPPARGRVPGCRHARLPRRGRARPVPRRRPCGKERQGLCLGAAQLQRVAVRSRSATRVRD
jgi:glyoxylase-like metal-dependent hydrolase (beta-lactamase superfamily II)